MKLKFRAFGDKLSLFGKIAAIGIALAVLCGLIAVPASLFFAEPVANVEDNGIANMGDDEKYAWEEIVLADMLPRPESSYGRAMANYSNLLGLYVEKATQEQYTRYIEACREKGFIVEAEAIGNTFRAFNEQGYELTVHYLDDRAKMNIFLREGKEFGALSWPDNERAQMLPVPESTVGEIEEDSEEKFAAYIDNSTVDDFNSYVQACEARGFTVESSKTDKLFSAKNADNYQLTVEYQGNNIFYISLVDLQYAENKDDCLE